MKRQGFALGVLAGAALLLAACKADVTSTVKSDGSGVLRAELGFTAAEKQQMEAMSSGSTTDLCNVSNVTGETPPAGMTFKQEDRGDETWCVATQPFANLDELRKLYADMGGVTVRRLEISGGTFYYDVGVDLSQGGTPPAGMVFTWAIETPGSVGANNADKVEGRTLTWTLTPGKQVDLQAESSLGGVSLPGRAPLWIVLGLACLCLLVVAVVVVVVVLLSRRKKPEAAA